MGAQLVAEQLQERRRRVRRSALLWLSVAAAFYFGYIVLALVRAAR
jgi:predicted nucleic acid-binding Zn ribbon protein